MKYDKTFSESLTNHLSVLVSCHLLSSVSCFEEARLSVTCLLPGWSAADFHTVSLCVSHTPLPSFKLLRLQHSVRRTIALCWNCRVWPSCTMQSAGHWWSAFRASRGWNIPQTYSCRCLWFILCFIHRWAVRQSCVCGQLMLNIRYVLQDTFPVGLPKR